MDSLLKWRKEFPSLEDYTYLINHSLGAMPHAVYSNLKEYADTWRMKSINAWEEDWWNLNAEVGNIMADILHAPYNTISMHHNVTSASAIILSCFEFTDKKDKVVYTDMHFPSIRYLLKSYLPVWVNHTIIESEDGVTVPAEKIADSIDSRTLLVPISHVFFKSSYIQDLKVIIEKAHDCGAYVIVDIYQSAGALPVDVEKLNVDVVTGGSIKWLCGGPGTAYLYVRPDLAVTLKPKVTGWFAHDNPFAFAGNMHYTENISYKFLTGTQHIPSLYAAKAGYEIIRDIGIENIRKRSLLLTQRIIDCVKRYGFALNTPSEPERRGGSVVVQLENSQKIAQELLKRKFLIDWRPNSGIRIGPHFYNTENEVDTIMEEIHKLSLQLN